MKYPEQQLALSSGHHPNVLPDRFEEPTHCREQRSAGAWVALTVVPRLNIDLAEDPGLAVVTLRNPGIVRTLGTVTRRGHTLSPAAGTLAPLIQTHLRKP